MSLVGTPAADFCLASTKNLSTLEESVSLADYAGRWLVLLFYPADFTYVCPTEILAFSSRVPEFEGCGAAVLAISTDSVHCHQAWIEFAIGKLKFPLASDRNLQVSRAYGVLIEAAGVAERGLFIIDPEGIVRYEGLYDMTIGRSVDEVLRVLRALVSQGSRPANRQPSEPDQVVSA